MIMVPSHSGTLAIKYSSSGIVEDNNLSVLVESKHINRFLRPLSLEFCMVSYCLIYCHLSLSPSESQRKKVVQQASIYRTH